MSGLGGVYIDVEKNVAVGVDGVAVTSFALESDTIRINLENKLAQLPMPYDQSYTAELRIVGLSDRDYELVLNDGRPKKVTAVALANYPLKILPNGQVLTSSN